MTETKAEAKAAPAVLWDKVTPTFKDRLREPVKPARPPEGAIAMAQKSFDGITEEDGTVKHAMSHRFPSAELAAQAADELKRAGAYTTPESTVTVVIDEGDKRLITWRAGKKRGRH